ncbi:protein trichome birefringence-like 34 [Salvia miltiorrhiza]|uniref:protein trichome birefringence-like 34 n=1 Tax=Salvia miltiorrhiza TaxID=226208 RepID=UPI0025ACAFCF|nr:protein trichome birefringence-like 34 [Salvia miltiorrhiza]
MRRKKLKRKNMSVVTWKDTLKFLPIAAVFTAALAFAALYLTINTAHIVSPENLVIFKEREMVTKNGTISGCNLFAGRWVYDDVSRPLYKEGKCKLMEEDFACEKYGRKNLKYQNWRWQPHQCDLPMFNGTALLEKLRNKKVVFVGDSLNRNQWRSFLCLTVPHLPPKIILKGNYLNFEVKDYNATISLYWSPYLVESNFDNTLNHGANDQRTIRLKSIEKHGRNWMNADILIFDTFAWWTIPNTTILWGSFNSSDAIYKQVQTSVRHYEIALNTWSEWLEFQVDRNKTKIFFMSASPFRLGLTTWGTSSSCYNATEPIFDETYWPNAVKRSLMEVAESTIEKLEERGVKVQYLNITQLSSYREDAHPSIYKQFWKSIEKPLDPNKYSDCMHWCLPGVPDTWNEILYAYIMEL